MNVIAIRCEHCDGSGLAWNRLPGNRWSDLGACPVCNGTGFESPPPDQDTQARKAIEGKTDEHS